MQWQHSVCSIVYVQNVFKLQSTFMLINIYNNSYVCRMQAGTCEIDGKCYVAGESLNGSDSCWKCIPENSTSHWTYGKLSYILCHSSGSQTVCVNY